MVTLPPSHNDYRLTLTRMEDKLEIRRKKLEADLEQRRQKIEAVFGASELKLQRMMNQSKARMEEAEKRIEQRRLEIEKRYHKGHDRHTPLPSESEFQLLREKDGLDIASRWLRGVGEVPEDESDRQGKVDAALAEIKSIIQSGDTFLGLLRKNYIRLDTFRGIHEYSDKKERESLERIYRENWKEFDPEWVEYLVAKFHESLRGQNEFSILRFDKKLQYASSFEHESIIGFLRYTPYDDGRGIYNNSVYLGAVNVAEGFQGYSLLRYMFEESAKMQFLSHDTIYLDTIPNSSAEKVWRSLGFTPVGSGTPTDIVYGKDGKKSQPLLLMKLTREEFRRRKQ